MKNHSTAIPGRWFRMLTAALFTLSLSGCGDPPPLDVTFRRSLLDSAGLVMIARNTGTKSLSCRMDVSSEVIGRNASYLFSLSPYGRQEIGAIQAGWSYKSGEKVSISVEGHASRNLTVP